MQEFFFTILAIWLIWKLFSAFNQPKVKPPPNQYYQANHHHYHQKQEGDVTIQQNPSTGKSQSKDDSEYTDYEEIK